MGRQFPLSLVRQVVAQPEEALYHLLASLQRKEFLYEQPAFRVAPCRRRPLGSGGLRYTLTRKAGCS